MRKNRLEKYLDKPTDVYHIVDEKFINGFSELQRAYMLSFYYEFYCSYCKKNKIKPLPNDEFLKNARSRKNKLVQICCPYCGNIDLVVWNRSCSELDSLKYCTSCGKRSTSENIFRQISSIIRMQVIHSEGLKALKTQYGKSDLRIISYDIWHMELIEMTCILEVVLRDFYFDLFLLKFEHFNSQYINDVMAKDTNNDFMNISKANVHYKKGLDINLKELVTPGCWEQLIDLVQIRNTIIHNNGMIDNKFKKSPTFKRIKSHINGDLIFVDEELIDACLSSLIELFSKLEGIFDNVFEMELHSLIANYYFNSHKEPKNRRL